jgi:hypothetical protein
MLNYYAGHLINLRMIRFLHTSKSRPSSSISVWVRACRDSASRQVLRGHIQEHVLGSAPGPAQNQHQHTSETFGS